MKQLRFSLAVTILALVLSVPAFAGDMQAGITGQPPSQPAASATGEILCGAELTGETTNSEATTVDPAMEVVLNLIRSMLSLF